MANAVSRFGDKFAGCLFNKLTLIGAAIVGLLMGVSEGKDSPILMALLGAVGGVFTYIIGAGMILLLYNILFGWLGDD